MALKHDAQGFLVGDPIDLSDLVSEWAAIRDDVRAIRQAVLGIENAMSRVTPEARGGAVVPPGREGRPEDSDPAVKAMTEVAQPMAALRLVERSGDPVKGQQADMARPAPSVSAVPARGGPEKPIPVILRQPALPQIRGVAGNTSRREPGDDGAVTRAVAELRAARPATLRAPVEPARRDDRGRFVKGDAIWRPEPGKGPSGTPRGEDDGEPDESLVRSMSERIAGAVKEAGAGLEDSDPAVKAMTEVAQPMVRGYEVMTGGDRQKKQEGWLRRIYGSLTGFRKEEGLFNKVAAKRLKAIEEKPIADGDGGAGMLGGILGLLGGLLAKIPGLGKLLPAAAAGAAGAAGAGRKPAGGRAPGRFGRMLRRVPVLGALIGGAGLAADLYESENDDTQTRGEKDRRAGRGVGGLAGSLGGMAAGAQMGALAGSLGGPIGAAIGGFVGGAVGMFLGDQAGQIIGEKVGSWVSSLREADIPGKMVAAWDSTVEFFKGGWSSIEGAAVGAWDWVKSGWDSATESFRSGWSEVTAVALGTWDWVQAGWDSVAGSIKEGWDSVTGTMSEGWKTVSGSMEAAWDSTAALASEGWQEIKDAGSSMMSWAEEQAGAFNSFIRDKTGVDLKATAERAMSGVSNAISSTKDAISGAGEAIAETATQLRDSAYGMGSRAVDAITAAAGRAWTGAKTTLENAIPKSLTNRISVRRAMETGAEYKQGNIAGLDDARTRALVASTAETESSGGKLDVVNSAGYIGRYQAGAGWLADAGLIKGGASAVRAAMRADGHSREYDWGRSGGMTRFLKNAENWDKGLSYEQYLASADVQDAAFKTNSDKSYHSLVRRGVITETTSQDEIAGLLKARHIGGEGAAATVARGGNGVADANGTTPRKYFEDLKAGNIYAATFMNGAQELVAEGPEEAGSKPIASGGAFAPAQPNAADAGQGSPAGSVVRTFSRESVSPSVSPVMAQSLPPVVPALSAPSSPVVASAAVPAVPAAPISPPVAEAPPVQVPMSSGDLRKPVAVVAAPVDVGQDLRERGIAHIATGGLSGGGAG